MRCYICDSTIDGRLTTVPFKKSRSFSHDKNRPWLDICSDCQYGETGPDELEEGEVINLEGGFDD